MNAVFCASYPEYAVAVELSKYFKKKDGYSINIPLSRQQKGHDLIAYYSPRKTAATIQVKSSRFYPKTPPVRKPQKKRFNFTLWFNNFSILEEADFYILFGLYPKNLSDTMHRPRDPQKWWEHKILLLKADEMKMFLKQLKKNKLGGKAHSFYLEFDKDSDDIFLTRGAKGESESLKKYMLEEKILDLKRFFEKQ